MRSRFIRALVNALGERGQLELPVVPQLIPVIPVSQMDRLGFPIGWPVRIFSSVNGVAAQRVVLRLGAPPGYIIRIDEVWSTTATTFSMIYGKDAAAPALNFPWTIVDPRGANAGLIGKLIGAWSNTRSNVDINACTALETCRTVDIAIPSGHADLQFRVEGPWYVDSEFVLSVHSDVDNETAGFGARGEAFELG